LYRARPLLSLVTVPPQPGAPKETPARRRARQQLVDALWDGTGARRLPTQRELEAALGANRTADVWWVCEMASHGPLYFLPTREWVKGMARQLTALKVKRVLEVGAGDGFVAAQLAAALPHVRFQATDTGAWSRPKARMSAADLKEFAGLPVPPLRLGPGVLRMAAPLAVRTFRPDLVLCVWAPPGNLVDRMVRAPVRHVLDVSVDGDVCGNGAATWRFNKEFLDGPVEQLALCRLDGKPLKQRTSRVTLYYGKAHPEFQEEKP
jgi:hypothetical protein